VLLVDSTLQRQTTSRRVEQVVGPTFYATSGSSDDPTLLGLSYVHGHPGTVFRFGSNSSEPWDIGFSWFEDGCDRTVFLAPGTTPGQALDYASRY
jgi:hypothetical protein